MHSFDPSDRTGAPLFLRLVTPVLWARKISKLQPAANVTFILSTGRTGTVYLADLFNQVAGTAALHEPKPSRVLNAWTTAYLEGLVGENFMATALASKRRKTLKNINAERYIESNNFIAGFANAVESVFENPTIIHIVRDPRDFATSLTNRGDNSGVRLLFNKFVPYWAYVPNGIKKRDLTAQTRAAHRWVAINSYLSEYGRGRANYHFFKFEDVFDKQKPDELKRLLAATGLNEKQIAGLDFAAKPRAEQPRIKVLDRPSDSTNKSKHQLMSPWRDWPDEERRIFENICGPLMQEYGYGSEDTWEASLRA